MEQITLFIAHYGWEIALIALAGVVLLGVLKYANVFSKVEKDKRKPLYFAVSVGFSVLATVIYLGFKGQFELNYILTISMAIYTLNQAMYAVYETTTLKDLVSKILLIASKKIQQNESTKTHKRE